MTSVTVVVGAQFGSEGKGAIAAHLTKGWTANDLAVRVNGPNAGHTVIDADRREWKLRSVPVAAVNSDALLYVAPGSEVDLGVLLEEITELDKAGYNVSRRLKVHPSATVIEERHLNAEQADGLVGRIGSTGKGIGAARADRVMRRATTFGEVAKGHPPYSTNSYWAQFVGDYDHRDFDNVLVEGTQGYGLGLHTSFYPTVTSSDCRAIDFLAAAGISPWQHGVNVKVVVVARVYPIRVAGNSGPLKGETTWDALDLPVERTTVTQKVRRVGEWDEELVAEALAANGHDGTDTVTLALTMLDQKFPNVKGLTELDDEADAFVEDLDSRLDCYVEFVGTGPTTVVER